MPVVGASTAIITIRAVDMTTSVMNNMSRGFSANAARLQSQIVANNAAITRSAQATARANELIQNQTARRVAALSREQVSIPKQISAEQLRVTQFAASEAKRVMALKAQDAAAQQAAAQKLLQLEAQRADISRRIGQRGIFLLPQRAQIDAQIVATRAAEAARAQANLATRQAIARGVSAEATAGMREVNTLKQRSIALTGEMANVEQAATSAISANNIATANANATRRAANVVLERQLRTQLNLAAAARVAETGRNIGRAAAQIGLGLTAVTTLPMLAAMNASTGAAMNFNKEMLNIQSIGKQTDETISALSTSFLKLSTDITKTTATPTDLANAFYEIQSSGFYGADASKILERSTKAATAGLADTKSTAMAAARSLNAYGDSANNVGEYLDIMVRGVDIGVYRMQDFNDQMGDFIAAAGMLGIPFAEVTAALTTMTKKGLGLDEAATSLNRIMMEYLKPSDIARANAAEFGIELDAAAIKANGFAAALQEVYDKTGGSEDALAGIFREMRAARGIFAIAGDGLKTYNADLARLRDASGSVDSIFATQMKSWSAQVQSFKNSLEAMAISIGSRVLPVLIRMIDTDLKPFIDNVARVAPGVMEGFAAGFEGFGKALSSISPEQLRQTGELFGRLAAAGPQLMAFGIVTQGLMGVLGVLTKIGAFLTQFPAVATLLGVGAPIVVPAIGVGLIAAGGKMLIDQANEKTPDPKGILRAQAELNNLQGQEADLLSVTTRRNLTTVEKERLTVMQQQITYLQQLIAAQSIYSSDAERLVAHQKAINQTFTFMSTATMGAEDAIYSLADGMSVGTAWAGRLTAALDRASGAAAKLGLIGSELEGGIFGAAPNDLVAAMGQGQTGGLAALYSGKGFFTGPTAAPTDQIAADRAARIVEAMEKVFNDDNAARQKATSDAQAASEKRLADATNQLEGVFRGLFQTAQDVSKALSDLTGAGGAGAAADPEGFMRDVRRLQAWIKDNSWGQEAAEHGYKTKEEAMADIGAMQRGDWSKVLAPEHNKLVDISKIQAAGMAQLSNDNFMQSNIDALVKAGLPVALAQQMAGPGGALPGAPALPGQALPGAKPAQAAQTIIQAPQGGGGISLGVDMSKLASGMAKDAEENQKAFGEAGGKVFGYWQDGFFSAADTSNLMAALVARLVANAMNDMAPAGV